MSWQPPVADLLFCLRQLVPLAELARAPAFAELDLEGETPELVLAEAARFASEVIAPIGEAGDREGARFGDEGVRAATGYRQAYAQFVEAGWQGLAAPVEHGGQGLPEVLSGATHELWNAADLSFALCPMLTDAAIQALHVHGTPEQRALYLPRLVSGEWSGTMNLTEPQAGSDLSAIRSQAVPNGDHYLLRGQKIFITWGEHELAENIVHLVLARTPGAPEGVRGLSLFLAPRFLPDADGNCGAANDLRAVSIERKLGIHGSPTCVMSFGEQQGALAWRVGGEHQGLACMFTMMNLARLKVGIEGVGLAARATEQAFRYAQERVQGQRDGEPVAILRHPDVGRMLLDMRSTSEAMRALALVTAAQADLARAFPNTGEGAAAQARLDLLTPIVKGWCTETAVEVASLGIQVHGGMGYVEETGAARWWRDSRITPIYEGTTGIQAADLSGRKLRLDDGAAMFALLDEIGATAQALKGGAQAFAGVGAALADAVLHLRASTRLQLTRMRDGERDAALAVSVPFLLQAGWVASAWQMARALRKTAGGADPFSRAKHRSALHFLEQMLPRALALGARVRVPARSDPLPH